MATVPERPYNMNKITTLNELKTAVHTSNSVYYAEWKLRNRVATEIRNNFDVPQSRADKQLLSDLANGHYKTSLVPSYKEWVKAVTATKELKVQLFKPKVMVGDVRVYKDTEMVLVLDDPTQRKPKQVYSIDVNLQLLLASYGKSKYRAGWLTNDYKVYSLTKYPIYKLREDYIYTSSLPKLSLFGSMLHNKTIVYKSNGRPPKVQLKGLYEAIGNYTLLVVRSRTQREISEIGSDYWKLPKITDVLESTDDVLNRIKKSRVILTEMHDVYAVKTKDSSSYDHKVIIETMEYELSKEPLQHEPVVTIDNKYQLCDQDIFISDRRLDILMEFHRILSPEEPWDDVLLTYQDANNEITFVVDLQQLKRKPKQPGVTKAEILNFLKELRRQHEDITIQR